jgi:MraZ protein
MCSGIEGNKVECFGIILYFYATKKQDFWFMIEFAGTYSATIDEKGRIVLPSSFKKELGDLAVESLVIEKNLHRECLDIHPEKFWRKRVEDFKSTLDLFDEDDDALLQFFYQNFIKVTMAPNGRINIPDTYRKYANLEKGAEFIGMGESIRLLVTGKTGKPEMSKDEFLMKLKEKRQKKV